MVGERPLRGSKRVEEAYPLEKAGGDRPVLDRRILFHEEVRSTRNNPKNEKQPFE